MPPTVTASMATLAAIGTGGFTAAINASSEALEHDERRPVGHVGSGEHAVDVHLASRDLAVEMRMGAEFQLRLAAEIDRPFFRPVLQREFPQRRRSGRGAESLPASCHGSLITRSPPASVAPTGRASESTPSNCGTPRSKLSVPSISVRQRVIGRIDPEPDLEAAVVVNVAARDPIAVRLVADDKAPSPLNGPRNERMSPSNESFCNTRREPEAASPSVMRPSSTLRRDMASASGLKAGDRAGQSMAPALSSPRLICGATRCTSLACTSPRMSGAKPDFKLDGAGTQARRAACLADLDVVQIDTRARQDTRVDRAVDVDGEAGQPARLLLE